MKTDKLYDVMKYYQNSYRRSKMLSYKKIKILTCLLILLIVTCSCTDKRNSLAKQQQIYSEQEINEKLSLTSVDSSKFNERVTFKIRKQNKILDSISVKGVLFHTEINNIDAEFYLYKFPVRAGNGIFREKTIIFTENENKLFKSLEIVSQEIIQHDSSRYEAQIEFENKICKLIESYYVKNELNNRNTFTLSFDENESIFSSANTKTVKLNMYIYTY